MLKMCTVKFKLSVALMGTCCLLHTVNLWADQSLGLGQALDAHTLSGWDIDIDPSGKGLPSGSGNSLKGTEIYEWNAVFAPANTPEPVVAKLAAAFQQALESPDVKARIAQLGGDIQKGSPDEAKKFIDQQIQQWSRVIKERGITTE